MDPFSLHAPGFVNLLASQSSSPIDVDSAEAAVNSPGLVKPAERRKWSTKEDLVLISVWLNTSKDPIVSNEQKLGAFWKRIEAYFNSSPQLIGSLPREWGQCKQRWGRVNAEVCRFVGSHETALKEQASGQSTLNDINVLDRSPVFDDILHGRAPKVKFKVNNHTYRMAYYLTDGIYPNWSTFIQSIPLPQGPKAEKFAQKQESARKDVERAFGVLQSRFAIVKNPALQWDKEKIGKIMRTCVILHNMIVENERHGYAQINTSEFESGESSRSSKVTSRESIQAGDMLDMRREVRDQEKHARLKADLMENIWQLFGDEDE
uniref:Myb-like domain-containing protein n=1 Tax=Brassica oleracea var. oleracea TaxID=109376 RepID=A0A0D3B8I5_BRAOL